MKKNVLRLSVLCFFSIIFVNNSFGQAALNDSSSVQTAQIISSFDKAVGQQSRLYDGHEYLPYDPHIKNGALFPYEATATMQPGEVNYDGIVYKNVPMMYDIYKDVVVVQLYNKFSMFTLLSNRVHDFTFVNHHFVRVEADSLNSKSADLSTGFYDQLYGGKVEALARRIKTIQNSSSTTAFPETYFVPKSEYYIRKGNIYYKVSSQGAVLNVFKDKKNELQQYIKQNKIKYNRDPEDAMAKIASYYDQLTN
jgi:hypothetical protein